MINGKKVVVVMPAYRAERTIRQTIEAIPPDSMDSLVVVDDASGDRTIEIAKELGAHVIQHDWNKGYGGNQKSCYAYALWQLKADIVVMLHPDYQYEPRLVRAMAEMVAHGVYDMALGSRVLGQGALAGGMPIHKYVSNRALTLLQNMAYGMKLSEYHTGYRAFTSSMLTQIPWMAFSDDFVFDNEMIASAIKLRFKIGEMSCPCKYFPEASSANLRQSIRYGLGCLHITAKFLWKKDDEIFKRIYSGAMRLEDI